MVPSLPEDALRRVSSSAQTAMTSIYLSEPSRSALKHPTPPFLKPQISDSSNSKKSLPDDSVVVGQYELVDDQLLEPADWDDLDKQKYPFKWRVAAGAAAGLVEHLVVYPADTYKTNAMTGLSSKMKIHSYSRYYVTRQAWRGVAVMVPAVTVAHALQFPIIECTAEYIESTCESNPHSFLNNFNPSLFAGWIGALPHDLIMNPANVVKQRMQQCTSNQKYGRRCAKDIYVSSGRGLSGLKPFVQSFPAQYFLSSGIYLAVYYYFYNDLFRRWQLKLQSRRKSIEPTQTENIGYFIARVSLATTVAIAVTQIPDNVVTRVNTQHSQATSTIPCSMNVNQSNELASRLGRAIPTQQPRVTILSAFQDLKAECKSNGYASTYSKGLGARLTMSIPANLLTWGTYEAIKYSYSRWQT